MELEKMYGDLGISKEVLEYGARIEAALEDRFTEIDGNAEYNQYSDYPFLPIIHTNNPPI